MAITGRLDVTTEAMKKYGSRIQEIPLLALAEYGGSRAGVPATEAFALIGETG